MKENRKSFWITVPAVLTSVAALIKAINGMYEAVSSISTAKKSKDDLSSKPLQESYTAPKVVDKYQIKNLK
ncbi:MAG: hypothetical protein JEZ14_18440 [Marinilabiliaceae bacterium]|nr:hypothetical protein [Marinilabiliaceae bacterium]